jgi:hypothetical protein
MAEQVIDETKQYADPDRMDLMKALMTPDQIVGALVYAVMRGELNNEIMELARSVPKECYRSMNSQEGGDLWDMVGYFVHSKGTKSALPMDDRGLAYLQDMILQNVAGMAAWIIAGRPGLDEIDWYGGEDED